MINYITDQGGQRFPKAPNYNNEPIVPSVNKEKAKAGDILLAKADGQKIFVTPEMWTENKDLYENIKDGSDPLWTPIGIVVVPYTHTPDGTVRCCAMDYTSLQFETNYRALSKAILYFRNNTEVEDLKTNKYGVYGGCWVLRYSSVDNNLIIHAAPSFTTDGNTTNSSFSGSPITFGFPDIYAKAYRTDSGALQNPYKGPNSDRSDQFYTNLTDEWTASLDLRMDGQGSTEFMFDVYDKWYEDSALSENQDAQIDYTLSPALGYIKNYQTVGTKQLDWYVPSIGEFAFFYARLWEIYNTSNQRLDSTAAYFTSTPILMATYGSTDANLSTINSYTGNNLINYSPLTIVHTGWAGAQANGDYVCRILPFISV